MLNLYKGLGRYIGDEGRSSGFEFEFLEESAGDELETGGLQGLVDVVEQGGQTGMGLGVFIDGGNNYPSNEIEVLVEGVLAVICVELATLTQALSDPTAPLLFTILAFSDW